MYKCILLLALSAVALAVPANREKRQAASNCLDAFKNVPNPCKNNPQNLVYFPHPTDVTKFIQCDRYQRMYIIQCPGNLIYSVTTSTCRQQATVTVAPAPATNAPAVVTNQPIPSNTVAPSGGNPCTASALAAGQIYFAVANDATKFIECDMLGHANILPCSTGLVWNEARLSCVYKFDNTGAGPSSGSVSTAAPGTGTNTGTGSVTSSPGTGNPGTSGSGPVDVTKLCTAANIQANKLFFAHPDPSKFIQCDLWGDAFVVSCPAGLIWNTYYETCASAFITVNGAGK